MWLVISICLASPAFARTPAPLSFARVVGGEVTGLDLDPAGERARATADAEVFARYRRLPETPEAKAFVAACADAPVNRFCPYLRDPDKPNADAPSREARNGLYEALLKLDDVAHRAARCPEVMTDLKRITDEGGATSLHSRALYWTWACATETGQSVEAARARDELWQRFPFNHLTLEVMRADRDPRLREALSTPDAEWTVRTRVPDDDVRNDLVRGIEALLEVRQYGAAEQILRRAQGAWRDGPPEYLLYITALAARTGENMPSVHPVWRTGVPLLQAHRQYLRRPLLELLFPRPSAIFATIRSLTPGFDMFDFIGLVHLESALNPRAASHARAYGLTQMLLPTANDRWRELSRDARAEVTKDMLFEPEFSLRLGAFDLTKRLATFDGNVRLALASYHAGETAVKRWLNETPPFRDPELQVEVIFLNREKAQRSADYVMNARSRGEWYRALYRTP